jgi:hypothetical protein
MNRVLCVFVVIVFSFFFMSSFFIYKHDSPDGRSYELTIASFNAEYNSVKRFWEHCEQCLAREDCDPRDRKRCEANTIEEIKYTMGTALAQGKIDTVRYLVEVVGLDIDAPLDIYQSTALYKCSYYGSPQHNAICRYLVSKGANVNAIATPNSRTPLLRSIRKHNYINAVFLLEQGADPGIRTAGGMDACEFAFRMTDWPILPHLPGCCQRFRDGQLEGFRLELPDNLPQPSGLCR